ncbi:hypothetical protein PR002_g2456 [Phytophthora rubi]|uniref:Uncharacterized protein n=1 Tax=Phytophthora rubi TaxID=129364 RepID=A0A6A3NP43_9STRA|nr:hypothetical protein PR002_g2456 [Phytophthora rubi]
MQSGFSRPRALSIVHTTAASITALTNRFYSVAQMIHYSVAQMIHRVEPVRQCRNTCCGRVHDHTAAPVLLGGSDDPLLGGSDDPPSRTGSSVP